MTRLNSAVNPETLQAIGKAGEMNLAQQKLNQDAAARNQQAQIAQAKLQMDREARENAMAMGVAEMDMQRARMQQQAQLSADRLAFDKEAQEYNRNFQEKAIEEEKRRYDEEKALAARHREEALKLKILEMKSQRSSYAADLEATSQHQEAVMGFAQQRRNKETAVTKAELEINEGRRDFDQDFNRVYDQMVKTQFDPAKKQSNEVMFDMTNATDPLFFSGDISSSLYEGYRTPVGSIAQNLSEFVQGSSFWKDFTDDQKERLIALGFEPGDTSLTDFFKAGEEFGAPTRKITDFGSETEAQVSRSMAKSLFPNDSKNELAFDAALREAFEKSRTADPEESLEILADLNATASKLGVNPLVVGDVLKGIADDVANKRKDYAAAGFNRMDLDTLIAMGTTQNTIEVGGLPINATEAFIHAQFFTPEAISGITNLASGAEDIQQVRDSFGALRGEGTTAREIKNLIGGSEFLSDAPELGDIRLGIDELLEQKEELEQLDKDLSAFSADEKSGITQSELELVKKENQNQIDAIDLMIEGYESQLTE